jgi:hypothetical protein
MKRKQRDAIIAMGIKIAAFERLNRDHCIQISDSLQEITNINRTLKRHGEAHLAHDLLPQFTELVKKVEKLEGQLNFKLNDCPIMNHSKRIADLEETAEALSETVDQLSTCKCEAGNQMLKRIDTLELQTNGARVWRESLSQRLDAGKEAFKRIEKLEETVYNSPFSKIVMEEYAEKIRTFELKMKEQRGDYHDHIRQLVEENGEAHLAFLKTIPDVEILKVQTQGVIRDVDTLKIQMHNLLPVHNNMMDEILKQKAFLEKVQSILDRERDDRIKKSPGYKKEIAAMKMDANAPKDANGRNGFRAWTSTLI